MKRDFLKQLIPGITDEQLDKIMAENGNDINDGKKAIDDLKAAKDEAASYKKQIADRDKDIKDLQEKAKGNDDLTKQLNDLQGKYKTDTENLQNQLEQQRNDHATEAAFASVPFASNLARKAAIADFKAKGYKLGQDGKYAEAESYITQLKKDDPAAFKTDEKEKNDDKGGTGTESGTAKPPKFTSGLNNGGAGGGEKNPFSFNFTNVRKPATNTNREE